jgi:hypothetical protein
VRPGRETSTPDFSCSGGTGTDLTKSASGHVASNLCFAFGGICGSRSAFLCIRGTKHQNTIFHARVGTVWLAQKRSRTCYIKIVLWHPVGFAGHLVHSGRPWRETSTYCFLG